MQKYKGKTGKHTPISGTVLRNFFYKGKIILLAGIMSFSMGVSAGAEGISTEALDADWEELSDGSEEEVLTQFSEEFQKTDPEETTEEELQQLTDGEEDSVLASPEEVGAAEGSVQMYRLFNPYSGEHLYTKSLSERAELRALGWKTEGIGWIAPEHVGTIIYRLYNPKEGFNEHFYTGDPAEVEALKNSGWILEGPAWRSDDRKRIPVYRLFDIRAKSAAASHHFTTDLNEKNTLQAQGWAYEGIAWYAQAKGVVSSEPEEAEPQVTPVPEIEEVRLLVNSSGIHNTVNLGFDEAPSGDVDDREEYEDFETVYQLSDPSLGTIEHGIYRATAQGTNEVTVIRGPLEKKYKIISYQWVAHRGYLDAAPENTMAAFREAVENGAVGVETDVCITKDGYLVLMHDETVDDMTGGTGKIEEMTYEEIKKLVIDNGNCVDDVYPEEHIPLLSEFLDYLKTTDCFADIEMKNVEDPKLRQQLIEKVAEQIKAAGMEKRSIVTTFNYEDFQTFYELETGIAMMPLGSIKSKACRDFPGVFYSLRYYLNGYQVTIDYNPVLGRLRMPWAQYHHCT